MKTFKILLLGFCILLCQFKAMADAPVAPLIQQFKIADTENNIWIVTATAIDGKFPSDAVIIDANCEKFLIRSTPFQNVSIDVVAGRVVNRTHIYSTEGIISTGFHNNEVIANVNLNQGVAPIQIELSPKLPQDLTVPISFHIVYQ